MWVKIMLTKKTIKQMRSGKNFEETNQTILVTKAMLKDARSGRNTYTQSQRIQVFNLYPIKKVKRLAGLKVSQDFWNEFIRNGNVISIPKKKNRSVNIKSTYKDNDGFYTSREWRALRVRVLEKYECKCMMCGMSPKKHGIVVHVDHIKPRSKYPSLSLDFNNLQILCEDCNLGKSNKYDTDWRPDHTISEESEIQILINAQNYI